MKNIVLFMLILNLQISANVVSQNKISLNLKNVNLKQCIKEIENKTNLGFLYNSKEIKKVKGLNVSVKDELVENVLNEVFENTGLTYSIDNNIILVKTKTTKLRRVTTVELQNKKVTITGSITDTKGNPVPFASICYKKETSVGCIATINGKFEIEKKADPDAILIISCIGYKTIEVAVENRTIIDIVLEQDLVGLEEVVVTGYSAISKERATGSFVKIKNEDLKKMHHVTINEKLRGAAPGVLLTTVNGDGGNKLVLQIRGQSTIKAGADPLLVVDGFPISGRLEDINPEDIESINILQDAAAASIWGARAANGVVVISTKKGSEGTKPLVELSYSSSIYSSPDLDDLQSASPSDVIDAQIEYYEKGSDSYANYKLNYGSDYELNPVSRLYVMEAQGLITETERDNQINQMRGNNMLEQYDDLFLRTGKSDQYNINIRGGKDDIKYFASLSHLTGKSFYVGDANKRTTFNLNNDFQLSKRLSMITGVNLSQSTSEYNGLGLSQVTGPNLGHTIQPYQLILDENGNQIPLYKYNYKSRETFDNFEAQGLLPFGFNHLRDQQERDFTRTNRNARLQLGLKYEIFDWLNIETKGMYEFYTYESRNYSDKNSFQAQYLYNRFTSIDAVTGELTHHIPSGALLKLNTSEMKNYTWRSQINLDKTINKHQINALVGFEMREVSGFNKNRDELGFDDQTGTWPALDLNTMSTGINACLGRASYKGTNFVSNTKRRFLSYYLNAAYTYSNKYTVTFSGRMDEGSMFGVDANMRRTPLWSVGGSWNLSKEEFFNLSQIDLLKLRATYGQNGNISSSSSAFTTLYFSGYTNWNTQEAYSQIRNRYNPGLKWETTKTTNLAVDFALLDHRIYGTFEYYNKKSEDVIAYFNTNPMSGTSRRAFNNAEISNKGYTILLSGNIGNKLRWNPSINLTYNNNEVLKADPIYEIPNYFLAYAGPSNPVQGSSINEFYGFRYAGLDETGNPTIYDEENNIVTIDDEMTMEQIVGLGSRTPKYWGAFTNSVSFGNFSLHMMLTYKFGHYFKSNTNYNVNSGMYHESYKDHWKEPGDENHTNIPVQGEAYNSNRNSFYSYSDAVLHKADHIRLQDISLKYNLPSDLLSKFNVSNIELNVQVSNVGLIWAANDLDVDPEHVPFSGNQGVVQMAATSAIVSRPSLSPKPIYNFGIKLSF